tara:strand:- start:52 stop:222 length:171 start_codon:yes stop_codon:yes gene_type:complete
MIVVFLIVGILFGLLALGVWQTFGKGGSELRDPIAEHAKMHELGIAHGHNGKQRST